MPKLDTHHLLAEEVKPGDRIHSFLDAPRVKDVRVGPKHVRFIFHEGADGVTMRDFTRPVGTAMRVYRQVPTTAELLETALSRLEYHVDQLMKLVDDSVNFDPVGVFRDSITGRDAVWTWPSSFQLESFIYRRQEAQLFSYLSGIRTETRNLTPDVGDGNDAPMTYEYFRTPVELATIFIGTFQRWRNELIDVRHTSRSTSVVQNAMDDIEREVYRSYAGTSYGGSALDSLRRQLDELTTLTTQLASESESESADSVPVSE